jgi:hypothetical protein
MIRTGIWFVAAPLALCACASVPARHAAQPAAPYPSGRTIAAVSWLFPTGSARRRAIGSDLWPCTWAMDDDLYCAWGDGGGFDGNDDRIGRVSLGFARVHGTPGADGTGFQGKNVWGQLPYAQVQADFGGKVDSLIAVAGSLFAIGGFWTSANSADPAHHGEAGPLKALLRSDDGARSWSIVSTSAAFSTGSFLDFGRDNRDGHGYVYIYYQRAGEADRFYLKRIREDRLAARAPRDSDLQYWQRAHRLIYSTIWSSREADASPVFFDPRGVLTQFVVYDARLDRYLLTIGHHPQGNAATGSAGQIGLFEAAHPWGPWNTVGYYDDWDGISARDDGDFLGLHIPSKWISADGASFWAVFSDVGAYDAFNLVKGALSVRHRWWQIR